ncbi:MAG: hypothetical protein ACI84C_002160 [Flavobacteriales bacterium]|jgi:hypothetical protein
MKWTPDDLKALQDRGVDPKTADWQVKHLNEGFLPVDLAGACTPEKGIIQLSEERADSLADFFDFTAPTLDLVKFVPASGAASRMFKHLFAVIEGQTSNLVNEFFDQLDSMPFIDELRLAMKSSAIELAASVKLKDWKTIATYILGEEGLGYASCPKGMVIFHKYSKDVRTAFEEHLMEGLAYANGEGEVAKIHFTVPDSAGNNIADFLKVRAKEEFPDDNFDLSYSIQHPSTDTLSLNEEQQLCRAEDGSLVFRPGGHGALIHNLNMLDSEIVFVKNIDNVVPESKAENSCYWKEVLGGFLLEIRSVRDDALLELDEDTLTKGPQLDWLLELLSYDGVPKMSNSELQSFLNRPIRVCGMVKNEGEPGGGPFWVKNTKGQVHAQIVESAQIDLDNNEQAAIVKKSTHFNPVDLVCCLVNHQGEKYNLMDFVDRETGFVSSKSSNGKNLKALELPGLWNGAMANWITVFVEVPLDTFNPVKTVNDLLRPMHRVD